MPIINCPECNAKVATTAVACPHCGAPVAGKRSFQFEGVNALILGGCVSLFLMLPMADVVWASSGRTDRNGCHTSKKEGYHCHGSGSGSSPSIPSTTPKGTGGSESVCLTYADCMTRGKIEMNINADAALNYFQQALTLKPNDIEAFTNIHIVEPSVMPILGSCTDYKHCMDLGNLATNQKNYQTALVNFKRALAFKLGDKYALEAIRNVCRYIQESRTRN